MANRPKFRAQVSIHLDIEAAKILEKRYLHDPRQTKSDVLNEIIKKYASIIIPERKPRGQYCFYLDENTEEIIRKVMLFAPHLTRSDIVSMVIYRANIDWLHEEELLAKAPNL